MTPQIPQEFFQAVDNRQGGQFEAPPENFNRNEYYGKKIGEHYASVERNRQSALAELRNQNRFKKESVKNTAKQFQINAFNEGPDGVRFSNAIDALYREKASGATSSRKYEIDDELDQLRADQRFAQDQWVGGGFMEARNNQAIQQKAVSDYLGGGVGGKGTTMQAPKGGGLAPKGGGRAMTEGGAPDILAQSPAMAQRTVTRSPYDWNGRPLSGNQLNQFKQQDKAYQLKMGNNPYEYGSASYNYREATNPSKNSFNRSQPIGTNTNPYLRNLGY